jgi:predicted extracellular nuclease
MKHLYIFLTALTIVSCAAPSDPESNHSSEEGELSTADTTENTQKSVYNIGFYNVENLFDTEDDPYTEDEWFLPESETQWDDEKYQTKLENLAKVIDAMNLAPGGPDLIGLCEVENEDVVWDLAAQEALLPNVYEVIHFESPDTRGIDVAAMYNPDKLELIHKESIPVAMPEDPAIKTRDILFCEFIVKESNEPLYFYVNHWSSRRKGEAETFFKRKNCALALLEDLQLFDDYTQENIIIVGDMNDYPTDKSLTEVLGADKPGSDAPLWNIQYNNHENGMGTYNHQGVWGCLDNAIVTQPLYDKLTYKDAEILKAEWMLYTNSNGDQYPDKTYGGTNYYGGYSDHLPICIEVEL